MHVELKMYLSTKYFNNIKFIIKKNSHSWCNSMGLIRYLAATLKEMVYLKMMFFPYHRLHGKNCKTALLKIDFNLMFINMKI